MGETTGALSLPGNDSLLPSQEQMSAVSTPAPQVTNPSTDTSQQAPATQPEDKNWHGHSFLGKMLAPLVNAGGHDQTTKVDDNGQVSTDITKAAPGTMFKHMLSGALAGLAAASQRRGIGFGGGLGVGFEGAQQQSQEQQDRQRQQAIQAEQLKQQSQKSKDEHNAAQDETHLRATEVAYNNAQVAQLGFNMAKQSQEFQDKVFGQQSEARDYFVKNGGSVVKQGLSWNDVQQAMASDKSITHSLHGFLTGETPVFDSDGKPVLETIKDPLTGKDVQHQKMSYTFDLVQTPDDHVLSKEDIKRYTKAEIQGFDQGTVKPGQTITGSRWFNLENQYQTRQLQTLGIDEKKAAIERDKAAAAAEGARAKDLLGDIKDKADRKQATQDWGAALAANSNDPQKSALWLRQNKPESFKMLAAAEDVSFRDSGETITTKDALGRETVVQKKQRLFSAEQKIRVTGPKGTFDIDPSQLDTFKANGYAPAGQQAPGEQQQGQPEIVPTRDDPGNDSW